LYDSYNRSPSKVAKRFSGWIGLGNHKPDQSSSIVAPESNCGQHSLAALKVADVFGVDALQYI
jgi:hypothetical protein